MVRRIPPHHRFPFGLVQPHGPTCYKHRPIQLSLGLTESVKRDRQGNPLFDPTVIQRSLNESEVKEATRLCAATNASLTLNISPWNTFWGQGGPSLPLYTALFEI